MSGPRGRPAPRRTSFVGAADEKDGEAKERLRLQSPLNAERTGLEVEIGSARKEVQTGEETRRKLAFDPIILKLTGESEVDPDADGVARVLSRARSESGVTLRDSERRREVLEADRESLESTGLASIDKGRPGGRRPAARVRGSGMPSPMPPTCRGFSDRRRKCADSLSSTQPASWVSRCPIRTPWSAPANS